MPNYCNNQLRVFGNDRQKFAEDVKTDDSLLSFANLIPDPDFENITDEEYIGMFTEEEKRFFYEVKKDWWHFRVIKWGTKWEPSDVIMDETEINILYDFETAWSPPNQWLKTISKNYDCQFILNSWEIGEDFYGCLVIRNGTIIKDFSSTIREKVKADLIKQPQYYEIQKRFIEFIGQNKANAKLEEYPDNIYYDILNLDCDFGEEFVFNYFDLLQKSFFTIKKAICNWRNKRILQKFQNFCKKQFLISEIIHFHTLPPMECKLLKNGGKIYQECEKQFYFPEI